MTNQLPVKTIPLHRNKRIGLILFIFLFLVLGCLSTDIGYRLGNNPGRFICLVIFGISVTLFVFGILAFIYLRREKFIGFFISSEGLNDISTGHNYGVIPWRDVTKIRIVSDIDHPAKKYIVLKVRNPETFINREQYHTKKRSLMLKFHYYGSPICFSNRGLDCTFEELETYIRTYYKNYQALQQEHTSID